MLGKEKIQPPSQQTNLALNLVAEGLQRLYHTKLLPVELAYKFHDFYSSPLNDSNFSSKPMVLVLGPYSTGKSTFIKHLLGRDYPGLNIGPEPTTDRFVATIYGDTDQRLPGNTAVADDSLPFGELSKFGNGFLQRFEVARLSSPVLKSIIMVDSPGVLAGEKQRINRGYEFEDVAKWFADRSDLVLLLFDVSKMTISDELRRVILAVKGNDNKVRIILNKSDTVPSGQLMRIYGAMMWTLKEVLDTPEVARVYIGSFWDEPMSNDELRRLFESEENDIYTDLAKLPQSVALRKLNDVIRRARLCKVHAYILEHLRRRLETPLRCVTCCNRGFKQSRLIAELEAQFQIVADEHKLPLGDFPDPKHMRESLLGMDFSTFPRVNKKHIEMVDSALNLEFPKLLQLISDEAAQIDLADMAQVGSSASPFALIKNGAKMTSTYESQWLNAPNVKEYEADFMALNPNKEGKIGGRAAKTSMVQSQLPSKVLHHIWTLADVDKDGSLTVEEYALAMHFIKMKQDGLDLPQTLPLQMHPVSLMKCQGDSSAFAA
mmetsp:Transcript_111600/g.360232  ORF Transcript_111600/g.360232 Transcript_111600/m.360232 type:complete len:547 (+) Transcript_111600:26-1666(+)